MGDPGPPGCPDGVAFMSPCCLADEAVAIKRGAESSSLFSPQDGTHVAVPSLTRLCTLVASWSAAPQAQARPDHHAGGRVEGTWTDRRGLARAASGGGQRPSTPPRRRRQGFSRKGSPGSLSQEGRWALLPGTRGGGGDRRGHEEDWGAGFTHLSGCWCWAPWGWDTLWAMRGLAGMEANLGGDLLSLQRVTLPWGPTGAFRQGIGGGAWGPWRGWGQTTDAGWPSLESPTGASEHSYPGAAESREPAAGSSSPVSAG